MEAITSCRVINKNDNSFLRIFTEWPENNIKITIFSSGPSSEPLVGEMNSSDVERFAASRSKTQSAYLDETRQILSGRDPGVEFVLKDSTLRWKRGMWNHGKVEMVPVPLAQLFLSMLDRLLTRHENLENWLNGAKAEIEELKASRNRLEEKMEEMIIAKNELEADLYRRFAIVLNSKKMKIRELDEELRQQKGTKDEDAFDALTDEDSESEADAETPGKENNNQGEKLLKRQNGDSDQRTNKYEEDKTEDNRNNRKKLRHDVNRKNNEDVDAEKASTSRNFPECRTLGDEKLVRKDLDVPKKETLLNFTSEDSEDDLFL